MSTAADKNSQALKSLFGDASLANRLSSTRIAVVTPLNGLTKSGKLLVEVLSDVLGRIWPNIDFDGLDAEWQVSVAKNAAKSGGAPVDGLGVKWNPPYDCVISIDRGMLIDVGYVIQVGANNWEVQLGANACCGDSDNPIGPAFAAALTAAQIFHLVFKAELSDMNSALLNECKMDLLQLYNAEALNIAPLNFEETYIFGVGAVTHGFAWLLERWPGIVTGKLHLVDQDNYGESNGQRYSFMRSENQGRPKVVVVKERLAAAHAGLSIQDYQTDLNSFCDERGYELPLHRVIAGLDSAEARRHVALKLPERAINMWTDGVRIGAGRYRPGRKGACLACGYLEKTNSLLDEVAEIHQHTGIRPDLVRSLLDSSRGLSLDEATTLSAHRGVPLESLVGEPLRSVLPALCATGKIQMSNNSEVVDVPFAFSSLFAGISGFMMLMKDCNDNSMESYEWTQHIFKLPTHYMHNLRHFNMECICCSLMANVECLSIPITE